MYLRSRNGSSITSYLTAFDLLNIEKELKGSDRLSTETQNIKKNKRK